MPWHTPVLKEVRTLVRDNIRGSLPGADASVPNSILRVMSDTQAALCHLTLQYIDWLALQLMPDTAETEWLDRHGDIWLVNADGTTGRKMATLAEGVAAIVCNIGGLILPRGTRLQHSLVGTVEYETTVEAVTATEFAPFEVPIRALDPGAVGNLAPGEELTVITDVIAAFTGSVVTLDGGVDEESDDDLRIRVLERIRQPPQGGALHDYVRWAKAVPGCTRAWCKPLEMGIGTVTVRVLFDELRADDEGWPLYQDLVAVTTYMDKVRPVAVKDFWVLAPIKQRIDCHITYLDPDTVEMRAAIDNSVREMLFIYASPGQTIFAAWKYYAIMNTRGIIACAMGTTVDDIMESPGHMAVLGDIVYA